MSDKSIVIVDRVKQKMDNYVNSVATRLANDDEVSLDTFHAVLKTVDMLHKNFLGNLSSKLIHGESIIIQSFKNNVRDVVNSYKRYSKV